MILTPDQPDSLLRRGFHALVLMTITCAALWGQTAQISGIVTDPSGAIVADASVRLSETLTDRSQSTRTNATGAYTFPFLRPGTYNLTVAQRGFQTLQRGSILLENGQQAQFDLVLPLPTAEQVVTVESGGSYVNVESGSVQTAIDTRLIRTLPVNGRSFQTLMQLAPGVVPIKSGGENGQFSVNGQRSAANYFTIDGVSANAGVVVAQVPGQGGSGALPALSVQGSSNNLVSVDALEEFTIHTSTYAPEFGRSPGGQVSLVTRSGTNAFHGTMFHYFRNDKLDANDFFANRSNLPRPPLRQNQFGGVIGGPLVSRERMFFFASYEGLRLREPKVVDTTVPSLAARSAAPASLRPLLNAFPAPTGLNLPNDLAGYAASYSQPSEANAVSFRVDRHLAERWRLFGRYSYSPSRAEQRKAAVVSNATETILDTQGVTAGATTILTPFVVNDARYSYTVTRGRKRDWLDDFGGARPPAQSDLFPAAFAAEGSYVIANFGGGVGSLSSGPDADNRSGQNNFVDSLSWRVGAHHVKTGVDYRRIGSRFGVDTGSQYRPTYNFGALSQALTGRLSGAIINAKDLVNLNFTNFSWFAQDSWRIHRRLTLTYGVRWEYNPPPASPEVAQQPYTITYTGALSTIALAPRGSSLYRATKSNFAPRVGAAWQMFTKRSWETAVRGGYGVFYDIGTGVIANASGAFPFLRTKRLPVNTVFPLSGGEAAPLPVDAPAPYDLLRAFDPNIVLPRTHQFNVTVEQSLGAQQVVSAAYVGARGRKLLRQSSISNPSPLTSLLQLTTNGDTSDYNALQVQFNRRLSKGLRALGSYTFGKSLDTSSSDGGFLPRTDRLPAAADRGPSDFDIRHSVSAALSYDLPVRYRMAILRGVLGGWGVDSVIFLRSATPVTVTGSRTFDFGFVAARPDLVLGVPLYLADANAPGGRRFNNTQIAPSQVGPFRFGPELRQGGLGRNTLRGLPFRQADIAVRRNFRISETLSLQARLEMFNAFNHPNFADPGGSLGSTAATGAIPVTPAFGVASAMLRDGLAGLSRLYQIGGPRSMQVSVRLGF